MVKSIPQADIGMVQPCGSRLAADECCPLSEDSDQRLELSEPWMENGLITVLHEATHDLGVIQETFMTVLRHALNGMKVCRTPTALTDWTWGGGDHGCPSERADRGSSAEPSDNQPIDKGPRYQYNQRESCLLQSHFLLSRERFGFHQCLVDPGNGRVDGFQNATLFALNVTSVSLHPNLGTSSSVHPRARNNEVCEPQPEQSEHHDLSGVCLMTSATASA